MLVDGNGHSKKMIDNVEDDSNGQTYDCGIWAGLVRIVESSVIHSQKMARARWRIKLKNQISS